MQISLFLTINTMKCHHFLKKHCQSCDLLARDYPSGITSKKQVLADLFPEHLQKIKPAVICRAADGSRNKAKLAVAGIQDKIEFGFYDAKMQFKKLEDCPLHAPAINEVLIELKKLLSAYQIIPYDLRSKRGELKYVLITYSKSSNELLLRFILRSSESLQRLKKLVKEIIAINSAVKVITANIQATHQAILEGEEEIVLTVSDCVAHHFDDLILFQGPRSFFQTNSDMALQLYKQFQRELSGLPIRCLLDLYCGVGAFSFFAAKYCCKVTGVEISEAAVSYANKAREINDSSDNVEFIAGDVEEFLKSQESAVYDAIIVNPPRRGLNDAIIAHLKRLAPSWLFYSSCNAQTLQRDLLQLKKVYQIESLQIFDMFPFSSHFETLVVLGRHAQQ